MKRIRSRRVCSAGTRRARTANAPARCPRRDRPAPLGVSGSLRSGEPEGRALGVAADHPALARVDDLAAPSARTRSTAAGKVGDTGK